MSLQTEVQVDFHDYHPETGDVREEVLEGLRRQPKELSPKFFYDERGSELFAAITELPEYYPTRTELSILRERAGEIAKLLGPDCELIEYGSGNSTKVRILLDALEGQPTYVAIDISRDHLLASAEALAADYPDIDVIAVCADYTQPFPLPETRHHVNERAVFFPGSTIGNFPRSKAREFLRNTAAEVGEGGLLLIGVDLKKDPVRLEAAYDDAAGVTAEFNLNMLRRINEALDADFALDGFRHVALYNEDLGRIEMHLESLREQTVHVAGEAISFAAGERIHTESSHKFTVEQFQALAAECGFTSVHCWTDDEQLFSVHLLCATAC